MNIDLNAVWLYAVALHGNQKDKSGEPYWTHLAAVWQGVIDLGGDVEVQAAAILHDAVEDTDVTEADLEAMLPKRTVVAIEAVTKRKSEHNPTYIGRIIAAGKDAMQVKLSDLYHNTHPERLADLPEYTQKRLKAKYYDAIFRIEAALGVEPTISEAERDEAVKANGGKVGSSGWGDEYWGSFGTYPKYSAPKYSPEVVPPRSVGGLVQKPAKQLKVGDRTIGYGEITSMRRQSNGTHMITFTKDGQGIEVTCGETRTFYLEEAR